MPALRGLIEAGQRVIGVLTQPDRAAGRGRKLTASPVKRVALEAGIPVFQPLTLRDPEPVRQLAELRPELMVVVAYGLLLPPAVLEIPALGCWNIHASLLPRWRGAAPIQRAILAGDPETGVCIMQMDPGLDTGPVLACRRTDIEPGETAGALSERLGAMGAKLLLETIQRRSELAPRAQPEAGVTHAPKISKDEAPLDWRREAAVLARQVRAFDPWPVAVAFLGRERLRIWQASALDRPTAAAPGEILTAGPEGIEVAPGAGVLRVEHVQRAGGRRMAVADYLNSRALEAGERFESPPGC